MFRCVYCLNRETWGRVTGDFEIDHFDPQSVAPSKKLEYENLVYACRHCNGTKGKRLIPDPFVSLHNGSLTNSNGILTATTLEAQRIIRVLDLNSPRMIRWRNFFSRIVELAKQNDESLHQMLVGLPPNLPDLKRLRPKENSKPDGVGRSWLKLDQRIV